MKAYGKKLAWVVVLVLILCACSPGSPEGEGTAADATTPAATGQEGPSNESAPQEEAAEAADEATQPPATEVSTGDIDSERCLSSIPVYPGSQKEAQMQNELEDWVQSMETMSQASGGEVSVYSTSDAVSDVVQFYRENAPAGGWERTLALASAEEGGIIVWEKGDYSAQMFTGVKDQEILILLGCGPKLGSADAPSEPSLPTYTEEDGLPSDEVTAIIGASGDSIWFGTGGGVAHFDGEHWTTYAEEDGLPSEDITCVAMEQGGGLWVGTFSDGAAHFDGTSWETYQSSRRDALICNRVTSVAIAPDGTVWFGSQEEYNGGVSHFDGGKWETYNEDSALADNHVMAIAVAPDGTVWAGTKSGLAKFDGDTWTNYTTADGLAGYVQDLAVDKDGKVWAGTEAGVSTFDGQAWTTYTPDDGLITPQVRAVEVAPDGSIWFGTPKGISHFDGESWENYTEEEGLPYYPAIISIFAAPDGKIWIGTESNGVAVLDPSE